MRFPTLHIPHRRGVMGRKLGYMCILASNVVIGSRRIGFANCSDACGRTMRWNATFDPCLTGELYCHAGFDD